MKAAIIIFPGSNAEWESKASLKRVYGKKHVEIIHHRDRFDPTHFDLVYLPGGFSYGDYLRAGACAALSPAMEDVKAHAKQGRYVLGVCNGFQILLEAGLLPGTLIRNESGEFECRWLNVEVTPQHCLKWTLNSNKKLVLPIANKFGRYYLPQRVHLPESQVVLRYLETGEPAAITNKAGNILGMMPHPERASFPWHHSQDGQPFFPKAV